MKQLLLIIIFVAALTNNSLYADTNVEINYLISTPVSKLDWGIFHLMQKLNNYKINNKDNPQVFVTFDEDKRSIIVDARIDKKGKTLKDAKSLCAKTIQYLKSDLGVVPETGKPYQGEHSDLYFYFGIYNSKISPKSLPIWLDRNTRISAKVFYEKESKQPPHVSIDCTSKLTSTKIFYGK